MSMRKYLPWWSRIGAKLLLSNLPVPYSWWRRLSLFRHGDMNLPAPAIDKFRHHFDLACAVRPMRPGFTVLELGPGDSVFSVIIARAWGASAAIALDAGAFALRDVQPYRRLADELRQMGRDVPAIDAAGDLESVLHATNGRYLTRGTASMAEIADGSIDFIWSCVVLEHVYRTEFATMAREMRRVLKPGGVMVHSIDLRDHLGGGLNNLRFSEKTWESAFFRDAGFYTNRLGYDDILRLFEEAGFSWSLGRVDRWSALPLQRNRMAPQFRNRRDEALCVAGFELILHPSDWLNERTI